MKSKVAPGLAFETWDPSNRFPLEILTLPFVIPSDCLNCQGIGGALLEVEAEGSALSFPLGRVPLVCAGVAGALHGLNKMGRSPFRRCLSLAAKSKNEGELNDAKPSDLQFRGPFLEMFFDRAERSAVLLHRYNGLSV